MRGFEAWVIFSTPTAIAASVSPARHREARVAKGDAARRARAFHLGAGHTAEPDRLADEPGQHLLAGEHAAHEVAEVERADRARARCRRRRARRARQGRPGRRSPSRRADRIGSIRRRVWIRPSCSDSSVASAALVHSPRRSIRPSFGRSVSSPYCLDPGYPAGFAASTSVTRPASPSASPASAASRSRSAVLSTLP